MVGQAEQGEGSIEGEGERRDSRKSKKEKDERHARIDMRKKGRELPPVTSLCPYYLLFVFSHMFTFSYFSCSHSTFFVWGHTPVIFIYYFIIIHSASAHSVGPI